MIDILRKQGNLTVFSENIIRPVQRPTASTVEFNSTFLPCKYCKGLYKKLSLRRHVKKCALNLENKQSNERCTSEGQTLLAFTGERQAFLNRLRLKTEVFHTMRSDRISLTGKSDPLICQYAEDYLKRHKRPHIKHIVSNKIRELGRLLILLIDHYNITSMLEALKPEYFDTIVAACRNLAGYNESTKNFKTPSLALHFRTTLLTVCSTAITLLLKKDPVLAVENYEGKIQEIKIFRKLVDNNWKFEMGSLALKDLTEKNALNKQKLPITQDILLFNNYCNKIGLEAAEILKQNIEDVEAFKKLSEIVLVLTISLNRKRIGDVQYIKTESYTCNKTYQDDCFSVLKKTKKN